jgi:hypothetical protein
VPNTPSTQRSPGPVSSPDAANASLRSRAQRPHASSLPALSTLELDGLHDGEEQHVESWLHLSLGLETG